MKIFLDTADPLAARHWLSAGVVDGGTSNPQLLAQQPGIQETDWKLALTSLAHVYGELPLSVQVTEEDRSAMITQGQWLATCAPNVVVKVPVLAPDGSHLLDVIHELATHGVAVNATACLSWGQALLALKAGARYASILWGRVADEGGDPKAVVDRLARERAAAQLDAEIIAGSVRTVADFAAVLESAADIVTTPPAVLQKVVSHQFSLSTSRDFFAAAASLRGPEAPEKPKTG